jgi:hypothetical protein
MGSFKDAKNGTRISIPTPDRLLSLLPIALPSRSPISRFLLRAENLEYEELTKAGGRSGHRSDSITVRTLSCSAIPCSS